MTMKNIVRLLALVAILTAAALPASAQWGPEEEKNCFLNGKKGTITLSGQSNSAQGDSSKLEQFEEIPNGFLVPCAAYGWSNENYFLDLKAIDALYDDQFLGATFGKKGGFLLDLTWDENPNWQSNTARTPSTPRRRRASSTSPDATRLALQNVYVPWVTPTASNPVGIGTAPANPTVPGFYAVENYVNTSLPTFDLRYVRKTGRAGISVPVGQAFVFDASYSREKRDGNKNTTFYGGPSYEVASPIEFVTDNFRFGGEFAKGRFFLAASVDFSEFKNEVPFVEVDNPERLQMANPTNGRNVVNDAAFFRLWMPPDNEAYQADFTGGITLPARHKVTGLAVHRQHEDGDGAPRALDQPQPADERNGAQPAFTIIPPYSNIEAQYDTFDGPGEAHRRPDPLARLQPVLPQVRARRQDRGLHLHEHGPRRRGGFVQRHRLHPRARGLGHREHARPRVRDARPRPAPRRELRPGQAHVRHPRVRRRRGRRLHPQRRLQQQPLPAARRVDEPRPQARRSQRGSHPAELAGRHPDRHHGAHAAHPERHRRPSRRPPSWPSASTARRRRTSSPSP